VYLPRRGPPAAIAYNALSMDPVDLARNTDSAGASPQLKISRTLGHVGTL